jgi:hypothetical protein
MARGWPYAFPPPGREGSHRGGRQAGRTKLFHELAVVTKRSRTRTGTAPCSRHRLASSQGGASPFVPTSQGFKSGPSPGPRTEIRSARGCLIRQKIMYAILPLADDRVSLTLRARIADLAPQRIRPGLLPPATRSKYPPEKSLIRPTPARATARTRADTPPRAVGAR